jgi:hypothetical protein
MVKKDTESFAVFGATRVLLCALVFFNVSCRLKEKVPLQLDGAELLHLD